MKVSAIVYTSNTGYTEQYANILADKTGLPVYNVENVKKDLAEGSDVIYLGWLMAGFVTDYKVVLKHCNVKAVCGVCLGTSGSQIDTVRKNNSIPEEIPVFTLQGGFDMKKLKGMHKFTMKIVRKSLKKQIAAKEEQTEDDKLIVQMLDHGGSAVSEDALMPVIELLDS